MPELTPIQSLDGYFAKREDLAYFTHNNWPSGAKVRQFYQMIKKAKPGTPLVVGCSASSAMQIYVAAAAKDFDTMAYVFVPRRTVLTEATQWAADHGACVTHLPHGYPSVYRKAAREKAKELGGCVRWDMMLAVEDAAKQTVNLPTNYNRIVIPTGSGATAAGVLVGLRLMKHFHKTIVCVCVSDLVWDPNQIRALADKYMSVEVPVGLGAAKEKKAPRFPRDVKIVLARHSSKYEKPGPEHWLPDGVNMDRYYAGKAFQVVEQGDVFWISGRRPV